jgi:hypothetical protein
VVERGLPGRLSAPPLHSTAKSDTAGRYRLRLPPPGHHILTVLEPDMFQAQSIKIFTTTVGRKRSGAPQQPICNAADLGLWQPGGTASSCRQRQLRQASVDGSDEDVVLLS